MKLNIQQLNKIDFLKLLIPSLMSAIYYFLHKNLWGTIFYLSGWYIGQLLMILDKKTIYKYYYESIHQKNDTFARLVTRSILFILAFFGLSLFLVTSTGSAIGMGLIMGIGLVLAFELWSSRNYVEFFNQYFIQSSRNWTKIEVTNFIRFFLVFYIIIGIFSVI